MSSPAAAALTAAHYRRQLAIKAESVRDAYRLWHTWTPGDIASWKRMIALAIPLVGARHALSSATAGHYFEQMASAETGRAEQAVLAGALPEEQIAASLAATGLVGMIAAKSRGFSMEAASQVGFVRFQGGFGRLALLGGRDTIVSSVTASPRSTGWSRVTSGEPCAFCADLAGERSTPDAFAAHDNCSCTAEPRFA